jgi:beta-RFAP synthase
MPPAIVEVRAPSRLHFGLLSFGRPAERQFGGLGTMIDAPGLRLQIAPHPAFFACGLYADRTRDFARSIIRRLRFEELPACRIEVQSAPPEHVGLGTGTQLAMAIAAGMLEFLGLPTASPADLAALTGRGARSAIGTYGFVRGGMILEEGKLASELISPGVQRVEVPSGWRFVLIIPSGQRGLAGEQERRAFRDLPAVPPATRQRLYGEAAERLLPAASAGDFATFSESLYQYGYLAGTCFAASQGGPFASPRIAQLVAWLRSTGIRGAGQSSWGPTVFALCNSQEAAQQLCADLAQQGPCNEQILIAQPDNQGATISRLCSDGD